MPRAPTPSGGRVVEVPLGRGFEFPLDERARGDQPSAPASSGSRTRTTRRARSCRATPSSGLRRPRSGALVFVDEAYVDFCGETLLDDDALERTAERGGRPDVRQGVRPGRAARGGARRRRPETAGRHAARHPALQPQRVRGRRAAGRLRRHRVLRLVSSIRSRNPRRCSTTSSSGAASRTGRARPTSCSRDSTDSPAAWPPGSRRAAFTCAIARRDPGCAGCLRMTAGVTEHTQALLAALEEIL